MAANKTVETNASVKKFLDGISDETKRMDSFTLIDMMQKASGEKPKMWGSAIVGFGSYHYVYESGREGDSPLIGFSPRKQNLTLYLLDESKDYDDLLNKLGKYTRSKWCLYIKKLDQVDLKTLQTLINRGFKDAKKTHPGKA